MTLREWIAYQQNKNPTEAPTEDQNLSYNEYIWLIRALGALGASVKDFSLDDEITYFCKLCLDIAIKKRKKGVPLAKIAQSKHFYKNDFITTFDTLDPRPETEFIIDLIKKRPKTVLDLGTGTGCLLLSIILLHKAHGVGVDISEKALDIARRNAQRLGVKTAKFLKNDWAHGMKGCFDLVVCNPPYVSQQDLTILTKETLHDPHLALLGDEATYINVFHSLAEIKFNQILMEVPKRLISQIVVPFAYYEYVRIYDTDIFVLNISGSKV